MSVKVRCPECEKVSNAPDRARGKAIKCPQCGNAVRVPIGKPAKKVAAPPPSSSMMIANLDLDRIEDTQSRICPKCGVEVGPEDIECPQCHVNLATGLLSERNKAEMGRKGPNPKLFYKEFLGDGIEFWKTEKRLAFRLTTLWILFALMIVACAFMSLWSIKPLVRIFWWFLGAVCVLIPPGLCWNLHTTIIDATMRKKKKIGKYSFDKFLGAALGLKLIFWFVEIAAPLHIVAIVFLVLGARGMSLAYIVAAALEGAALFFASLLFPVAMVHMSMPITTRGWLLNKLSKPFFRTFPAVLYWCLFLYLTLLAPLACVAVGGIFSARGVSELIENANMNTAIFDAKAQVENIPKGKNIPAELDSVAKLQELPMHFSALLLPSALLVVAAGLFALTAIFPMRTNGLYGRYFMDRLDLETMVAEVTYVPKVKNLGEFDAKAQELSWKPVLMGLGLGIAAAVLLGGSIGMSFLTGMMEGATYGLILGGGLAALIGLVWVPIAAAKKKSALKFATTVLATGLVVGGIGAAVYATTTFQTGPSAPPAPAEAGKGAAPGGANPKGAK